VTLSPDLIAKINKLLASSHKKGKKIFSLCKVCTNNVVIVFEVAVICSADIFWIADVVNNSFHQTLQKVVEREAPLQTFITLPFRFAMQFFLDGTH
jgi:hypothetical protein